MESTTSQQFKIKKNSISGDGPQNLNILPYVLRSLEFCVLLFFINVEIVLFETEDESESEEGSEYSDEYSEDETNEDGEIKPRNRFAYEPGHKKYVRS